MAATTTAREEGVLKLVHPGRHVEIHLEPISAAEVMKKNPRHSVTRPDIFEFPWLVVKPESILAPGKVFFIVPSLTIYKLNKEYQTRKRCSAAGVTVTTNHEDHSSQASSRPREQEHGGHGQSSSSCASQSARDLDLHRSSKQKLQNQSQGLKNPVLGSCWNPVTASPREQEHGGHGQIAKDLVLHRLSKQKLQNQSQGLKNPVQGSCWNPVTASPREQEHGGHGQSSSSCASQSARDLILHRSSTQKHQNQSQGLKNPVQASCWNPVTASPRPREQDLDKRVKKQSQVGCWPETIAKDRNHRTAMVGSGAHISSASSQGARNGEKSTSLVIYGGAGSKSAGLKSCLRKHGSARKHTHRVAFALPDEDLYQLKTVPETESL